MSGSIQARFVFDGDRCSGCMACVVACQDQHDLPGDISLRWVTRTECGPYPARVTYHSNACRHCPEPACLKACPAGAIVRHAASGIVTVDKTCCTGCRTCAAACPFGVPQYGPDGLMLKCDFCGGRIEAGLDPACAHTCTTGALQYRIDSSDPNSVLP